MRNNLTLLTENVATIKIGFDILRIITRVKTHNLKLQFYTHVYACMWGGIKVIYCVDIKLIYMFYRSCYILKDILKQVQEGGRKFSSWEVNKIHTCIHLYNLRGP